MKKLLVLCCSFIIVTAYEQASAQSFTDLLSLDHPRIGSLSQVMGEEMLAYNDTLRTSVQNIHQQLFSRQFGFMFDDDCGCEKPKKNKKIDEDEEEEDEDDDYRPRRKRRRSSNNLAGVGFVLNFLLPFGIGSFVQGDTGAGTTILLGQLISIGVVIYGITVMTSNNYYSYSYYSNPLNSEGFLLTMLGYIGFYAFGIYGWIAPWVYHPEQDDYALNSNVLDPEFYALSRQVVIPDLSFKLSAIRF